MSNDYERYRALIASVRGKSLDEACEIAAEIEQIKNRHGGIAPTAPVYVLETGTATLRADAGELLAQITGRAA